MEHIFITFKQISYQHCAVRLAEKCCHTPTRLCKISRNLWERERRGEKTLYPVKPWVTRAVEKNESRARGVMGNDVLVSAKLTFFLFFYTKHKQFQTVIREYCQLVCFRNMRKIATQHSQQAGKMRSEFSMTQELPMVSIKGTDGICFSFLASLFELWEHLVCKIRILL